MAASACRGKSRMRAAGAGASRMHLSSRPHIAAITPAARSVRQAPARQAVTITATEGNQSKVKGHRRSEEKRMRNKSRRSELRTRMKRVYQQCEKAESSGDFADVESYIAAAYKAIDKGAKQGAIHRNSAARAKHALQKRKKVAEVRAGVLDPALTKIVPHTVAAPAGSA